MNEYINIKELIELNPDIDGLEDGAQLKMNHPSCPAGQDTKERLFIKNKGATLLAYCHHCNNKGVLSREKSHIRRGGENLLIEQELHLPPDFTLELRKQPAEHVAWLYEYGITRELQERYNIGWSDTWNRTILPVYDQGKLVAYQRRRVLTHDTAPKYLTTRQKHIKTPVFKSYPYPPGKLRMGAEIEPELTTNVLVLTEDILSAIKVGQVYDAWSLLGTYMANSVLDAIAAAGYTTVVVWFDDDNPTVRESQKKIRRRLSQIANAHVMRREDLGLTAEDKFDPKVFDKGQLYEALGKKLG